MISFEKVDNTLILIYEPGLNDSSWVFSVLKDYGEVKLKKVFIFKKGDVLSEVDSNINLSTKFIIGHLADSYFKIEGRILSIKQNVFIHNSIRIESNLFIAPHDISVFKKIAQIVKGDIYIGGDHRENISSVIFNSIIKNFPTSYEITKYVDARLSAVVGDCLDLKLDFVAKYNQYMNKKPSLRSEDLSDRFIQTDLDKYLTILRKLQYMISNEGKYSEKQWQREILQIILLLYPKYIYVFEGTPVRDEYSGKTKQLDFLLVDSGGNIDIIEIKKPFDSCIVSNGKYRDNHIPLRELSGTVMQVEKYIYFLNKWGKLGETKLTVKYKKNLPANFKIRITNPSGMIIMGRSNNLAQEQKNDFEVIRRKYKNIIDILTYDDLLERLESVIGRLNIISKKRKQKKVD